jgi:hypothetical protein
VVHLPELLEKYCNIAEFLFVYTDEMRATTATQDHHLPAELEEFAEPPGTPPGSRLRLEPRVRAGLKLFGLSLPCLLDNEQREVQRLYSGGPKRLFIVDRDGRIALDSGNLPRNAFPWKEITNWLDHYGESVSPLPAQKHG